MDGQRYFDSELYRILGKIMATICANKDCKEPQPVMRARWVEGVGWLCLKCAPRMTLPNIPGTLFPYVSFGISDSPGGVKVKSLRHLRQLEAKHGVQSVAFNQDSPNWDIPPRGR